MVIRSSGELVGAPFPLNKISIRILGINTPETRGAECPKEKEKGLLAKQFLKDWFANSKSYTIKNLKWDKFGGRILGDVYLDDRSVSKTMIENGHAFPYFGEKKINHWCP